MVVATLAKPTTYSQLAELLQQFSETGSAAPELIDAITGSDPPPTDVDRFYLGNREEAYDAIQCTDSTVPTDLSAYSRAALAADEASPDFGRISVFDVMPCAFWRGYDADRHSGPWNRRTSAPILVLNTKNDPATPLAGAYAGAAELADAEVVGNSRVRAHEYVCREHLRRARQTRLPVLRPTAARGYQLQPRPISVRSDAGIVKSTAGQPACSEPSGR